MSVRDSFSASEWRTLEFAPLWAFMQVAGIDRNVDQAEMAVLAKELSESLLYKDELTRGVLSSIAADFEGTLTAWRDDDRKCLPGLQDAAAVLSAKAVPASAETFKKTILGICAAAAKASGTPGAEVSNDEAGAFIVVAGALGVTL